MKSILQFLGALLLSALVLCGEEPKAAPIPEGISNVTPDQAEKLLQTKKEIVVLDLRTPEEFQGGHLAGATNLNFLSQDFAQKVTALDHHKTYLIHCASGSRSTRALKVFEQQKFPSILHLNQGIQAWQAAGKPVTE